METECCKGIPVEEWDAAIDDSDDTWLFHTADWLDVTGKTHSHENWCIVARHNGRIVGGMPLQLPLRRRRDIDAIAQSIDMGSCGPYAVRGLSPKFQRRLFAALQEALVVWAQEQGVQSVCADLPPLARNNLENHRGVNPLVMLGWRDVSTHVRIADLTRPESELWSDLAYDARRSVKLARTAGFTVRREEWPEMLDEYYRVHTETYERTGVHPHPRAYFEVIARVVAARGHAALWVARDRHNRPVAFHNCGRFHDGALYWTGCSESDVMREGVNYLLFWEAILGAKQDGCRWYEIGESFPAAKRSKEQGLTTFKKKFGGQLYRYYKGELELRPRRRRSARSCMGALGRRVVALTRVL